MRLSAVLATLAMALLQCRPAERHPAEHRSSDPAPSGAAGALRLEGLSKNVDALGVHIVFQIVNGSGNDAYAFTTENGVLYDDGRRALDVLVRQSPYTPDGSSADCHFFLQPYAKVKAHERREVRINLPRMIHVIDWRPNAGADRSQWPIYQAEAVRVEVGWSDRPFEDALDGSAGACHEELARRVIALQRGVVVADVR
jgi:hypothetical protein